MLSIQGYERASVISTDVLTVWAGWEMTDGRWIGKPRKVFVLVCVLLLSQSHSPSNQSLSLISQQTSGPPTLPVL